MTLCWFIKRAGVAALFVFAMPLFAADRWYLLIPQRSEYDERSPFLQGYRVLDQNPLAQWAQQGAYDSASECDGVRNKALKLQLNLASKSSDAYVKDMASNNDPAFLKAQRSLAEAHHADVAAFKASRCIANDDRRLRP